jgi:ParB family transcriptional regulator, chromosome partitioning protein
MATKKLKGLGRGLDALLGGDSQPAPSKAPSSLPITQIQAGKYQPRTRMDETSLSELAASIKTQGIMQPVLVRPLESGASPDGAPVPYEIIAGERRFRAAQMAGLDEIPVLVREVDDQSAAAMALIENIQREDLNPLEEAQGIQRLINDFNFTHEQAAASVGRSRSAVSNLLRLINLAQPVQTMLMAGDIDMGHARALLAVESANQITLANQVIAKRLSVRETEKLVARALEEQSSPATPARAKDKPGDIVRLEEELSDKLATPVVFKMGAKGKGQLIIDFADLDILDGVLARLRA